MDNPEPGRSSSSPNVRITSLRNQGADGSVQEVRLDDGSLFLFDADHPVAGPIKSRFEQSEYLTSDDWELLESAAQTYLCRRKALDYLARAEQCRRGLESKLNRKGYSREVVDAALDRLEENGLLDDYRFAEAWTRSRLRSRPEGSRKLIAGLMAKGISGGIAAEAVDAVLVELGDEFGRGALERAARKLERRSNNSEEKLISALLRRGFPMREIRRYLLGEDQE